MRAITPVWKTALSAGIVLSLVGWFVVRPSRSAERQAASVRAIAADAADSSGATADPQKAQQEQERLKKAVEEARRVEEQEAREIEHRIQTDPLWQASHVQTAVIRPSSGPKPATLNTFCVNTDGNLLAACGGDRDEYIEGDKPGEYRTRRISEPAEIRVLSPEGKLLHTWAMAFRPEAICVAADGTIFVGGDGRLAKLDQKGRVLTAAASPAIASEKADRQASAARAPRMARRSAAGVPLVQARRPATLSAERSQPQSAGPSDESDQEAKAAEAAALAERAKRVTGIAVTDRDVFVCCPMRKGWSYAVWRTDHNFGHAAKIVEGLIGCCGQMDVQAYRGELWVAHSCRHRVERFDRDGKKLLSFGKYDRRGADGFSGCCEPKNLRFGPGGELYTCESIPVVVVKRFTAEGKFVSVVGIPEFNAGCGRTTIDRSRDGRRFFVLNRSDNSIHVLTDKRG